MFCEHVGQLPAKAWAALLLNNAAANPEPQQRSAQCEKYESVFNAFALKG